MRFGSRRVVLLLCLAGCDGGSSGATDAPSNVDGAFATDTGGADSGDGARQDGVADAVVDVDTGGSQSDAAAAPDVAADATSVDAPADNSMAADAAPDAGAPDAGPLDTRPSDAADAPTNQASPVDGSNDAGGNVDAGTDGPTFSSTPGAGVVRSYETALWARSGHPSTVYSLDWSRDGARVVSVGAVDQTIRIFDARSGNLRRLMRFRWGSCTWWPGRRTARGS